MGEADAGVFSECAIAFVPSSSLAPRQIGEVRLDKAIFSPNQVG